MLPLAETRALLSFGALARKHHAISAPAISSATGRMKSVKCVPRITVIRAIITLADHRLYGGFGDQPHTPHSPRSPRQAQNQHKNSSCTALLVKLRGPAVFAFVSGHDLGTGPPASMLAGVVGRAAKAPKFSGLQPLKMCLDGRSYFAILSMPGPFVRHVLLLAGAFHTLPSAYVT
jgi:hypothetical protein